MSIDAAAREPVGGAVADEAGVATGDASADAGGVADTLGADGSDGTALDAVADGVAASHAASSAAIPKTAADPARASTQP